MEFLFFLTSVMHKKTPTPIPTHTISIIVPNKNSTKTPASSDTRVTERTKTIIAIGKTEESNSFIDVKIWTLKYSYFLFTLYFY